MMNCTDFHNYIDDYCDGELSAELVASCDDHQASCSKCAGLVADQNRLLASLKAMPVVGPSEGFAERALSVAMAQREAQQNVNHHHHHRRGFMVGFGSAAAAALALWVVVGVFPGKMAENIGANVDNRQMAKVEVNVEKGVETSIPEFSIALNEQRDIKLAFFSSEDLKGAQITLQMPENIALVGYEGQRELAWKINLARGNNLLRLPVMATGAAGGQLVARIEYMGKVKTLKVNLVGVANSTPESGAPGVSGSTESGLRVV